MPYTLFHSKVAIQLLSRMAVILLILTIPGDAYSGKAPEKLTSIQSSDLYAQHVHALNDSASGESEDSSKAGDAHKGKTFFGQKDLLDSDRFWDLNYTDRILFTLGVSILVLLLFVVIFAFVTIGFRIKNIRKEKRWKQLEATWEPLLIRVLAGDEALQELHAKVRKPDRLRFVDFLMRYTQHFRGEELDILTDLARPYLPLVERQCRDRSSEVRARAVNSLSTLGFQEYKTKIVNALDDPSPLVAMIAARALMRKDEPELAEHVLHRLHRFIHWSINYLSSMLADVGAAIAPTLRSIFSDKEYSVKTRAVCADALRQIHDFEAAAIARDVLSKETDRDVCAAALRLLDAVGLPEHLPAIRKSTDSPDFVIRAQAYRALGNIGGKAEIPVLESAMGDQEPWVAIKAAYGILAAGGERRLIEIAQSGGEQATLAKQVLLESDA
ncbi:MAG: HEAT repeat domain-containing protein [Candidatus Marinimicrobia bacterium]|nr:HEAT repeat domain-containing protein [Candidatus Neomarinimicrobiota bacterium]MCF7829728.1 HEAT repeat domain-containing protein [Candidatus Neomarinimicrobiota bacterium]MCF7881678.1 HEAT repeat domain-containing protein [Candidatus Neomarinimicrobiota bacterium]